MITAENLDLVATSLDIFTCNLTNRYALRIMLINFKILLFIKTRGTNNKPVSSHIRIRVTAHMLGNSASGIWKCACRNV